MKFMMKQRELVKNLTHQNEIWTKIKDTGKYLNLLVMTEI